ncbi:MAG TPA: ATP-binding protein, partial [Polyangiaceae bacterium]|nr:ATP-binding protein [Polyangiaceae bacterium]
VIRISCDEAVVDVEGSVAGGLAKGRYARVRISDTGTGIEPENIARLFEPFFTTKPPGVGTGLGLPAVQGIMASHQGAVTVDSRLGEGTTIELHFPATGQ